MRVLDFRSDTLTKPTDAMREAMYRAEVGDDVYGEDSTVNQLESRAAEMLGKEAGLFVSSGTQGNLIALLAHCQRGDEVILEADSHIFMYEVAGISALAGLMPRLVKGHRGIMSVDEVEMNIRGENIHYPSTGLICYENTHNRAGGTIYPLKETRELSQLAKKYGIPLHLDGARAFNAAVKLGISGAELVEPCDTVSLCLSKGLGAPVGSVLVGDKEFIERSRKYRKMLGGGMRQVGIIASAGLLALDTMVERLAEDHANASVLAEGLAKLGFAIDMKTVETNIILCDVSPFKLTPAVMIERLGQVGIKIGAMGPSTVRFVTHFDVNNNDVDEALKRISTVV